MKEKMGDLSARLYHSICDSNCTELQRLIDNGADVNQIFEDYANISTKSILHIACEKGKIDCVKILLENNAIVNIRDKWGMTPIRYCLSTDYDDIAVVLIQKDPEAVDSQDKYGKSVLHAAVEDGSEKFVRLLVRMGADVNITTDFGVTPLMTLMSSKNTDNYFLLMNILIDAGADVLAEDYRNKRTALHLSAITKKVDAVELLLEHNANPNQIDKGGRTPLTNLLSYNIPMHQQGTELKDDVMTIAILLTQAGTDLDMVKTEFCNPLIMAAYVKCSQLIRFFLDSGANVDVKLPYSGVTPLLVAVKQEHVDTIRALMDWNCRLDIPGRCHVRRDDYEFDPFELAVDQGLWDIVELFITAGYNVSKVMYLRDTDFLCNVPQPLKDNAAMLNYLRDLASSPHSLMKVSSLAIYKAIKCNIKSKIDLLPLPVSIKEYLKF